MFIWFFEYVQSLLSQRFEPPGDTRSNDAGVLEPLLGQGRALTAAPTHDVDVFVLATDSLPRRDALRFSISRHQSMAQFDGGLLPLLLVYGADLVALIVIQDWQINAVW